MGAEGSDGLGEAEQFSRALSGKTLEEVNTCGRHSERVNWVVSSRVE